MAGGVHRMISLETRGRRPAPGAGQARQHATSRSGHDAAGRIMAVFPGWLVMWGAHSRQFWAYPCFDAPPGTILHAPDPSELAGMMRRLQRAVFDQ